MPFLKRHSLSVACAALLALWLSLYSQANPATHWGSFFGNASADWTGVVLTLLATKYLYERAPRKKPAPSANTSEHIQHFIADHKLTLFLLLTGVAWITLYASLDSESKYGQLVGNIVSEWTQILGFVLLTKRFMERSARKQKENQHKANPTSNPSGSAG